MAFVRGVAGAAKACLQCEGYRSRLSELDKHDLYLGGCEPRSSGPFSVFHVRDALRLRADGDDISQWSASTCSSTQRVPEASSPESYLEVDDPFDDILDLPPNHENDEEGPGQSNLIALERRPFSQSSEIQERLFQPSSPSIFLGLTTTVYQNTLASQLMANYVHQTANILQPIPFAQNTYNSIYVPMAMLAFARSANGLSEANSNIQTTNEAVGLPRTWDRRR